MNDLFKFHKLNEKGQQEAIKIAVLYNGILEELNKMCNDSREFSIAKTKLEESCFFAKKAMAIRPENQE